MLATTTTEIGPDGETISVTVVNEYFDENGNPIDPPVDEEEEPCEEEEDDCGCDCEQEADCGCCDNGGNDVKINITFDVTIDNSADGAPVISMAAAN